MFSLRPLWRGLRALVRPGAADRDVDDEVRHYLDEAVAAGVARGLPTDQALREAIFADDCEKSIKISSTTLPSPV